MNLEKVVFGFFVVLAATLNFGFFVGPLGDPTAHNVYELFAAVVVNIIATVLLANIVSVVLLVIETSSFQRR